MPKSTSHAYLASSRHATVLLGELIRTARKERKMTAQELADRAGISRGFLQRIEKGNLKCQIGAVFEVASLVGIRLFDADETALVSRLSQAREKQALLPKSVRRRPQELKDDF